jgi:MoaA/NifB/PqqE/SkfB family radical SAM enzyme/predicted hotdog family 3-hydroxylacyl-ACP dehydratase
VRGDSSIRTTDPGFTADELAACVARMGLLSFELELTAADICGCPACKTAPQGPLSPDERRGVVRAAAKDLGAHRCVVIADEHSDLREVISDITEESLAVELYAPGRAIDDAIADLLRTRHATVTLTGLDDDALSRLANRGLRSLAVQLFARGANLAYLPAAWRRLRSRGVEPRLQILHPGRDADLSPAQWDALVGSLYAIDRDEFGRTWPVAPPHAGRSNLRHLYSCHVAPCGTVYASADLPIPLGTVRTESLKEILELSEVLENLRAYRTKVKEPCRTCSQSVDCYGSRGAAFALTGDYLAGDPFCEGAAGVAIPSLPVDVGGMIPHGPSIRMVDQLTAVGERRATTRYTVKAGSPFVDESGRLDESAYVEMIAQSFAASHGFHLPADEQPLHRGLLIGIKDLIIHGVAMIGDALTIDVHKVTRFGDFGVVDGAVHHEDGRLLATGQIKVWRPSCDSVDGGVIG